MLLWHLGATTALVRYAFRDPAMDLRFLALGAILSDVIDLPIAIVAWDSFRTARLAAHTLAFAAIVMVVVLVLTRRGPVRKRWMLLAVGVLLHLLLDAMWRQPDTLWWPFLGWEFTETGFASYGAYARDVLTSPLMWAGEFAGAAYLAILARRSGLVDPAARRELLRSGRVGAPID